MSREAPIVFILLIIQPIINLLTGQFSNHLTNNITIGMIYHVFLIILILIYLGKYFAQRHVKLFILFLLTFMTVSITFFSNFFLKQPFLFFQEVQYLFKTIYYICIVYITYILLKRQALTRRFILKVTTIIALIISGSYWIAFITNTSLATYATNNAGYSGWFFAPNELSVTVILLLALTSANLFEHTDQMDIKAKTLHITRHSFIWMIFLSVLLIGPFIGTKTAFIGSVVLLITCVVGVLLKSNLFWQQHRYQEIFVIIAFVYFLVIPWSPIKNNLTINSLASSPIQQMTFKHKAEQLPHILQRLLSSRDQYFLDIYTDYAQAPLFQKTFGLGYAGNYINDPKIIEMDFFDMFFSYGVIGTILLLVPLCLIIGQIIKQWKKTWPTLQVIVLTIAIFLAMGIAFLAGHVIFAPSVITYVMLTFLAIGLN